MTQALGYEFGQFKLKDGISEAQLLQVSKDMDQHFYPTQQGFVSHQLIRLVDGEYMDLVIADTQVCAEKICANWQGNEYCEAFVALIDTDSVSIKFGEQIDEVNQIEEGPLYVSA